VIGLDAASRGGFAASHLHEEQPTVTTSQTPSQTEAGAQGRRMPAAILLGLAVVAAIAVRALYLDAKPFWRDEAWVALLADHPARAILEGRPVPFGFLWLIRLTRAIVPGPPEISYRFAPFVVGIAIVPLLARMASVFGARRWVAVAAAWIAVGLVPLVYYSRELKPYDIDMALAILVPMLAIVSYDGRAPGAGARIGLLALLIAAPWITYAGIFPVAALLSWGWLVWARRATPSGRRDLFLGSAAFAVSFVASYVLTIAPQASNPRLQIYWSSRMIGSAEGPLWRSVATGAWDYVRLSTTYFFDRQWLPMSVLAAIGAVTWPRRHRMMLVWMYAGSAVFCIAAAATDRYLIAHGRHLMFAMPPLILWSAQGLWTLARPFGRLRPVLMVALPVGLATFLSVGSVARRVGPYRTNITEFFRYDTLQDVDDAISAAAPLIDAADPVMVSLRASYAFQFYRDGRLPQATYCEIACPDWTDRAAPWLDAIDGRAWLFLTDEEGKWMGPFLAANGLSHDERVSVRGARVWELHRTGAKPDRSGDDAPARSGPTDPGSESQDMQ